MNAPRSNELIYRYEVGVGEMVFVALSLSPLNDSFVLNVQGEGILIDKMSNGAPQIVFKSCNLRQSICFIHTDKYTRASIDSRIDI